MHKVSETLFSLVKGKRIVGSVSNIRLHGYTSGQTFNFIA